MQLADAGIVLISVLYRQLDLLLRLRTTFFFAWLALAGFVADVGCFPWRVFVLAGEADVFFFGACRDAGLGLVTDS